MFGRRLADFFTGRDPRGGNVATTINPQVQQAAWDAMAAGCNGPCKGAVVALEPSTGKILAMVSAPSYDPNLLATHDVNEQSDAWQQLRDNPGNPLLNRAISETYPPGSTFKVITTAAALQNGATPDVALTAAPRNPLPDSTATLENFGGTPCGGGPTASLREAFAKSCNTAFVQLGINTGADALESTALAFGLDARPRTDSAAGRRVHRGPDQRRRRPGHVEHRAEGRRTHTPAERAGGRHHREQRGFDAALPGRQPQGA